MKRLDRQDLINIGILCASLLLVLVLVWSYTGLWPAVPTPYNSHFLQAKAWLSGRFSLPDNPSHLEIAIHNGKYFVSFPPLPSVFMLPFALLAPGFAPEHYLNLAFALLGAVYAYLLARNFNKDASSSLFYASLLTIGSNLLFLFTTGMVWFLLQTMSFTFTMMSLYFATSENPKPKAAFLCIALAVGCRPFQLVYGIPVTLVLFLTYRQASMPLRDIVKKLFEAAIPALVLGFLYAWYNLARFGNLFEFGHNYLPEFLESPDGQFSIKYLAVNMRSYILMPTLGADMRINYPIFNGFSIFLINPMYAITAVLAGLYLLKPLRKDIPTPPAQRIWVFAVFALTIIAHLILIAMHKTMGGWHFGNRYAADTFPAVYFVLLLITKKDNLICRLSVPLLLFGVVFNAVGAIMVLGNR